MITESNINDILSERHQTHGEFNENSRATWAMLEAIQAERNWPTLSPGMRHAIYMITHKLARIATGDAENVDNWDDIQGYAKCVSDRIRNPILAYPSDDMWAALARGWNCSIEEAKSRAKYQMNERRAEKGTSPSELSSTQDTMREDIRSEQEKRTAAAKNEHYLKRSLEEIDKEIEKGLEGGILSVKVD